MPRNVIKITCRGPSLVLTQLFREARRRRTRQAASSTLVAWSCTLGDSGGPSAASVGPLRIPLAGADPGFWERGGGSDKYIHNWRECTGGGVPPPVTARGSGGALIAPQWGLGRRPSRFFAFAFI